MASNTLLRREIAFSHLAVEDLHHIDNIQGNDLMSMDPLDLLLLAEEPEPLPSPMQPLHVLAKAQKAKRLALAKRH